MKRNLAARLLTLLFVRNVNGFTKGVLGSSHHPFAQCWVGGWLNQDPSLQPTANGECSFTDEVRSIWSYDGDTQYPIVCIVEYDLEESIC